MLIPLAAAGLLGLAAVVAVHELAEVIVIANGVGRDGARPFGRGILPPPGNAECLFRLEWRNSLVLSGPTPDRRANRVPELARIQG